jgi:preprotein translocase subunit SecA
MGASRRAKASSSVAHSAAAGLPGGAGARVLVRVDHPAGDRPVLLERASCTTSSLPCSSRQMTAAATTLRAGSRRTRVELWNALQAMYPISLDKDEIAGQVEDLDHAALVERITEDAFARYEEREAEPGEDILRKVERRVILSVVDRIWREHL